MGIAPYVCCERRWCRAEFAGSTKRQRVASVDPAGERQHLPTRLIHKAARAKNRTAKLICIGKSRNGGPIGNQHSAKRKSSLCHKLSCYSIVVSSARLLRN